MTSAIGFDVVVIDNTPSNDGRNRMVWSNNGIADYDGDGNTGENWNNMDDAGELHFSTEKIQTLSAQNSILSFSINNIEADITDNEINIVIPEEYGLTSLVADFEVSEGAEVYVNDVLQISGETENDFRNELEYEVYAENEEINTYTVRVDVETAASKLERHVTVYPNPFTNNITIAYDEKFAYDVFNVNGQLIKNDPECQGRENVNLSGIPGGCYILRVTTNRFVKTLLIEKK
ncbi:MAG: T9SS type A sorting domain-containing protein [Prolixibacteraceae bacterium]|nr:T9SS type A sorting domain-containing protein [Prolixibacteraceae bacterium]